jgi:pimeloyl-ACP methyl ester carboxylesterase
MRLGPARRLFFRDSVARPTELDPAAAAYALRAFAAPPDALIDRITQEEEFIDLDRLHCPVLLIWGERDRIVPLESWGRPVEEALPHAGMLVLEGLSHLPMIDDPALVAGAVVAFTERHAGST